MQRCRDRPGPEGQPGQQTRERRLREREADQDGYAQGTRGEGVDADRQGCDDQHGRPQPAARPERRHPRRVAPPQLRRQGLRDRPGDRDRQRQPARVQEVGEDQRPRPPLADEPRHRRPDREAARHHHRRAPAARGAAVTQGGLHEPRAADPERRPGSGALQEADQEQQRLARGRRDVEQRGHDRQHRGRQRHLAAAPAVGGRAGDEQCRRQAQRIDSEQGGHRRVRHAQLVAVDEEERRRDVGAGRDPEEQHADPPLRAPAHRDLTSAA